jgi:hypothetical protein
MIYPQLSGEPNFVLIGVAAVFGLIIIIVMYYIITNKNQRLSNNYNKPIINKVIKQNNNNNNNNNNDNDNDKKKLLQPLSRDSSGYYAAVESAINSPKPSTQISSVKVSNPNINQVFNIKENIYTLDDASAVCGALGAEPATIQQLIEAHKKGADWCNVGWTKDGLAAYPIQYSTWKTLQDNEPNKRNICGRPGINLARNDPNLLYGVNCYGVKPEPKGNEIVKDVIISDKQRKLEQKIAEFQRNMKAIGVAPFNTDKWSV